MAAMSSRLAQFTRRLVNPPSRTADVTPNPTGAYRHLYIEGVTPADRWAKHLIATKSGHAR